MQKTGVNLISLCLMVIIHFTGCSVPDQQKMERENHERMIAILDSINLDAKNDPLKYFYANEFRLAFLDSLVEANPGIPQLEYRHAIEFQNSRELEKSIPILENLLEIMQDPVSQRMANEALAISYLRLAEVNNCIENYTPVNCILPFDEKAIHQNKQYVKSAIMHLETLLEDHTENYNYYWMYNIAHIANGTYPDEVLEPFLISGLQDMEEIPEDLNVPRLRDSGMMDGVGDNRISGSACVEDFNGNGHLDIFTTSYGFGDEVLFYESDGNGNFSDRTEETGLTGIMGGLNIECADLNNSGAIDILILRGAWLAQHGEHPNSLLRNNSDGTFTDITLSSGLFEMMPTQVAAFADINHNGYLDIFIGNESSSSWQGVFVESDEQSEPYPSAIFLNNGDETFTKHEMLNGFELDGFVKGASWGDINNNGFPDLYVSILGEPNKLFAHRGLDDDGLPVFEDITRSAGVEDPFFSFPVWFFDFNNNGLDDILAITYDVRAINDVAHEVAREKLGLPTQTEYSRLFKNLGDETFEDVTEQVGLNTVMFGMGANFGDLNNSGYPDFYIGTGAPDLASIVPNRMFLNRYGQEFIEATASTGTGHLQKGHGVSFADFDDSGSLDIYTVIGGAVEGDYYHNALFRNQSSHGNWLLLKLEGTTSNRQAIGTRIEVVVDEGEETRSVFRTLSTGGSFGANNSRVHVGLGDADAVKEIIINWPGTDQTQVIENPEINRLHEIRQQ
jgi:hypothetical protein